MCVHQLNKTSIIVDASKYIEELKEKVERLDQEIGTSQTSSDHDPLPVVNIFTIALIKFDSFRFFDFILQLDRKFIHLNLIDLSAGYGRNSKKRFPN